MARHFTKEEIDEIRKQLATRSVRDTDFEETTVLHDDDTVAIVQEGSNRQISVDAFRNELQNGPRGYSTYEIAVQHGYEGTEEEWLNDPVNGVKGNGIKSIESVEEPSLEDSAVNTYRITTYDDSTFDFSVSNGKGISSIALIGEYSELPGAINTYKITYSDGTFFNLPVKNGVGVDSVEQRTISTEDGGTNVVRIILSNGEYTDVQIKNGNQGNSGYTGAAEELEVVNNLVDGGATKALSAEQGKELKTTLDNLMQSPLGQWRVKGNGNTYSSTSVSEVVAGNKYRVYVKSWPHDEVTSGAAYSLFRLSSYNGSTSTILIDELMTTETLLPYYDIELPDDSQGIVLGGRVNSGAEGVLVVEDITAVDYLKGKTLAYRTSALSPSEILEGKMFGSTGHISSESSINLYKYPVTAGFNYLFSGRRGKSPNATVYMVAWYDANQSYIKREKDLHSDPVNLITFNDVQLVAPADAAFAFINVQVLKENSYSFRSTNSIIAGQKTADTAEGMAGTLGDIAFRQESVEAIFVPGRVEGDDGSIVESEISKYTSINVSGADAVRFLGYQTGGTATSGYAFYDDSDNVISSSIWSQGLITKEIEYNLKVPKGAITFRTTILISGEYVSEEDFYIYRSYGKTVADSIKESEDASKRPYAEVKINGNGNTFTTGESADLLPGHTYRMYVQEWPADEITSGATYAKVYVQSYNGTEYTELFGVAINETISEHYDFTVPLDSIGVYIGGRINVGEQGIAYLEDITAAKEVDRKIDDISDYVGGGSGVYDITKMTPYEVLEHTYVNTAGAISTSSSNYDLHIYQVTPGEKYLFSGELGGTVSLYFVNWFDSDNTYIGRESYKGPDAAYEKQSITAPEGVAYAYLNIQRANSSTFAFYNPSAQNGFSVLRKDIDAIISNLEYSSVEIMSLERHSHFIDQGANYYKYNTSYKNVFVPVSAGQYVKVISNKITGLGAYFAWLASDTEPVRYETPDFVPGTISWRLEGAEGGNEAYYLVPEGAEYLFVYLGASPFNYAPSYVGISSSGKEVISGASAADSQAHLLRSRRDTESQAMGLLPLSIPVDENGWEIPQTVQQLNTVKKALQMCNIQWTPKATLPGKNGGSHAAGVLQTGIPYSGNWHEYKYIGIEVSIHTFMTAVNNPYSLLYTENISIDNSKSAWGKTYYNTNGWMYYGTVCCGFSSSVNGQPTKYGNNVIPMAAKTFGVYVRIYPDREFDVLKIGDIYDNSAHSFLVLGLQRDSNGRVTKVKVAESTGTKTVNSCRIKDYSRSSFLTYVNKSGDYFHPYRCADLYKNIEYEPSEYVPLTEYGEEVIPVTYNNDICCFAGDKATFMAGDRVAINYNLTESPSHQWTGIEVYKDSAVSPTTYTLSAIDQSALDESQQYHALDLGTTLAAGKYKARMTDGTNYSDYTYWEVLPNNVTITENDNGSFKITVAGHNKMRYVYVGQTQEGGWFFNRVGREPDFYEAEDNIMNLFVDALLEEWGYTPDLGNQVRIMIQGDYGMAATPPITLPGRSEDEGDDDTPDDPSDDSDSSN